MRGALYAIGIANIITRITPAHAGSIMEGSEVWAAEGDHPRACGEHIGDTWTYVPKAGSPPRMRGAFARNARFKMPNGITPAHAGSISLPPSAPLWMAVSPPRMRGAFPLLKGKTELTGITPAHAGSI